MIKAPCCSNSGGALNLSMSHQRSMGTQPEQKNHFSLTPNGYISKSLNVLHKNLTYISVLEMEIVVRICYLHFSWFFWEYYISLVFHFIVLSNTVLISISISITSLLIVPRNIYGNHILCKLIWIASRRVFQSFDWTIISSRMRLASIMPSTNCKSDTNMCKS